MTTAPRAKGAPSARGVAGYVVERVIRDQAFAAAVLDVELERATQLSGRDRALATELVYGALRMRPWLEAELGRAAHKGLARVDPTTLSHLLVAGYQLFGLSRVPAFAAVSEAVNLIRRARGERVGAFANAVLRRLSALSSTLDRDQVRRAQLTSVAPWLKEALEHSLGAPGADAFLLSATEIPPIALRVSDPSARGSRIEALRAAHPEAEIMPGLASPRAILVRGAGDPKAFQGAGDKAFAVQEEGSQLVALALGARRGEAVLDACAGRGNKTAILAEEATCDAADLHPQKLERLARELKALGLPVRSSFAVDWSRGTGEATGPYDAILVDAPCSGIGTLRRRPELWTRRSAENLAELSALQKAIVSRAASLLGPGGRLVYAVCSVLTEESEEVLAHLLASRPELHEAPFQGEAARTLAGQAPRLKLLPHVHGTDGYFLASLRRE